ncbi:MAG: hypothetical protein AAF449_23965, partial [Myxococcota bacterium]
MVGCESAKDLSRTLFHAGDVRLAALRFRFDFRSHARAAQQLFFDPPRRFLRGADHQPSFALDDAQEGEAHLVRQLAVREILVLRDEGLEVEGLAATQPGVAVVEEELKETPHRAGPLDGPEEEVHPACSLLTRPKVPHKGLG